MIIFCIWVPTDFLPKEQQHTRTNQTLLEMVQTYKGTADIEAEKLQHKKSFYNLVDEKW